MTNRMTTIAALAAAIVTVAGTGIQALAHSSHSTPQNGGQRVGSGTEHRHMRGANGQCPTHVSSTGNEISHCGAGADPYLPDIDSASADDINQAQQLLSGVMQFCRSHPNLESIRRAGYQPVRQAAMHWSGGPHGVDPSHPRMAVVNTDGQIVGVVFTGGPSALPPLGSIPRPHQHAPGRSEMLHVWCTAESLETAFATRKPAESRGPVRADLDPQAASPVATDGQENSSTPAPLRSLRSTSSPSSASAHNALQHQHR